MFEFRDVKKDWFGPEDLVAPISGASVAQR